MDKYNEFIEKYGKEEVVFKSYYKYSFTFANDTISVSVGGNGGDIYRLDVVAGEKYTIGQLEPTSAYVNGECVYDEW